MSCNYNAFLYPENAQPLLFDKNEPNPTFDPNGVTVLENYHDNHTQTDCRAYKLLGVYLDEHLTLDFHVNHIVKKTDTFYVLY